jgi:hypothetical protein
MSCVEGPFSRLGGAHIGVGYLAWKWIGISLDSWMVFLVDMVQYCTVSHIPGAQGGSQFFGLSDFLFWCGDITVQINIKFLYH